MQMNPYEMLTSDEMTILKEYCHAVKDCKGQESYDRALKVWSDNHRKIAKKLMNRLRENGFFIDGFYPSGSLRFSVVQKSLVEQIMDLSDDEYKQYMRGELNIIERSIDYN